MLYAIRNDDPFICIAVDLSKVDVIELTEVFDTEYPRHKYTFNFYKADANDAILSFDVSGIPKKTLLSMWKSMLEQREGAKADFVAH